MFLRQINPKTNKTVAECLSEDVNKYNMMKVRVNAQVKAIVSFIEGSAQLAYIVILYFTIRTSFGTLLIQSMLYLVILPYFSLMNTSYNKDRIIENGWMGVVKNLWSGKVFNRTQTEDVTSSRSSIDAQKGVKLSSRKNVNAGQNGIFTTTSSALEQNKDRKILLSDQLPSDSVPSTSKGSKLDFKHHLFIPVPSENRLEEQNQNSASSIDTILLKMMQNTHEEDKYIRSFKQLVEHVYSFDQTPKYPGLQFQDGSLPNSVPDISYQQRNKRCNRKRSNQSVTASNEISRSKMMLDATELTIQCSKNYLEQHKNHRKTFRDNILKEIRSCAIDDDKKKLLIEELIDKEESYVSLSNNEN